METTLPIVVILSAIPVEYQAIKSHLTNITADESEDGTIYEKGEFHSDGQDWTVVIRETGQGNVNATSAVYLSWEKYEPDVVIFCGIAGGIKDVNIGDIVVASKVYNYHSGKHGTVFSARPDTWSPSLAILERAKQEAQNGHWQHPQITSEQLVSKFRILVKPIASGEEVVASTKTETLSRIASHYNDAVAIEMEGYGFLSAAERRGVNERLLIRGISDLLDNKGESDRQGCQQLAASNAAKFTFQVLRNFRPKSLIARSNLTEVQAPKKKEEAGRQDKARIVEEGAKNNRSSEELRVIEHFRNELRQKGTYEIGIEERIRLFVLAGSLLPYNVKFNELGNHLLHKMYLYRSNLNLTSNEQYLVYTTLLKDSWNCKTGWFWLRKIPSKRTIEILEQDAAAQTGDDKTREGAIKILEILESTQAEKSFGKILKDCEHTQKRYILDYLCIYGSKKSLGVVDELTVGEHEGVTSKAILAKIGILSRHEPLKAIQTMIEEAQKDPKICEEASLAKVMDSMSTRNLRRLSAHSFLHASKELAKRGKATTDELNKLLESDIPEIRFLCYSGLLKQGSVFDPKEILNNWPKSRSRGGFLGLFSTYYSEPKGKEWLEKTLLEAYLKMPITELEGSVESRYRKEIAYLAWGLNGGRSVVDVIRNDLKTNFKRHKVSLLEKIAAAKEDSTEDQQTKERLQNTENNMTEGLIESAFKVLRKYGNTSDKVTAKAYIKSENAQVKTAAVDLFAKYAGKKDIDILLEPANDGDVKNRTIATKSILKLNGEDKHIQILLDSSYSDVIREVIHWHIENNKTLNRSKMTILLCSKNDEIRLLTAAYAIKTCSRPQLVSLLNRYLSGETYYYDVVCWLDRVLFAPKELSQGYKKKLIERLD